MMPKRLSKYLETPLEPGDLENGKGPEQTTDMASNMNRRDFLKITTFTAVAVSTRVVGGDTVLDATAAASDDNIVSLTAVEAVTAIRRGEVRAEDYAKVLLSRAERLKDLNAYIALNRDGLMESARAIDAERKKGRRLGPLAGLPLLVKDNIDTKTLPTTAGCKGLAENRPKQDAPVLKQLLSSGALLMAKMNMHELAIGITSTNATYGAVRNPYDRRMIPGGSSGGTAAGIAARMAPAGLGSDTGGSMRIPAALCGVVGFRPSVGNGRKRYSTQGVVPISHTRDTVGPMGRTVGDVALLDSVITGQSVPQAAPLKGLRLGVPRAYFWDDLDGGLAQVAESALARLKAAGAVLVEVSLQPIRDLNEKLDLSIAQYEIGRDLRAYLAAQEGGITFDYVVTQVASKDVASALAVAKTIKKDVYDTAIKILRPQLQKLYADYFAQHAVAAILFPTTPLPARPINKNGDTGQDTVELNGKRVPTFPTYARNTAPASNAGLPGLTVPAGMTNAGLPVGLEFDGPVNSDRTLLGIGMGVENEFGTLPPPKV